MSLPKEQRLVLVLCFLTDLIILWLALNAATLSRLSSLAYLNIWMLQVDRLICVALFALCLIFAGAYNSTRISNYFDSIYYAWIAAASTGILLFAIASLVPDTVRSISRREIVLGIGISAIALTVWRYFMVDITSRFDSLHRFFYVVGSEQSARRIAQEINTQGELRAEAQYLTRTELEKEAARRKEEPGHGRHRTSDVIIALTSLQRDELTGLLTTCEENFRQTYIYPCLHDTLFFQHSNILAIAGIPLIEVSSNAPATPYLRVKRLMDLAVSGIGLILALPLCIVTAVVIKLTSPGGAFYSQERMGLDGRIFRIYKFRSMVQNAESKTGPVWAQQDDARVTPVGNFIRKHRIDEVPQLWSVFIGDMSLIGPRPERPHFHKEFCEKWPLFDRRLAVRPGLTSLSHVLGSYSSEPEDRLRYDLVYINNPSFLTDLKILLATIRVVLGAKGAQ